jgi:hypothetical protein
MHCSFYNISRRNLQFSRARISHHIQLTFDLEEAQLQKTFLQI